MKAEFCILWGYQGHQLLQRVLGFGYAFFPQERHGSKQYGLPTICMIPWYMSLRTVAYLFTSKPGFSFEGGVGSHWNYCGNLL
jgi:hypothetical protein